MKSCWSSTIVWIIRCALEIKIDRHCVCISSTTKTNFIPSNGMCRLIFCRWQIPFTHRCQNADDESQNLFYNQTNNTGNFFLLLLLVLLLYDKHSIPFSDDAADIQRSIAYSLITNSFSNHKNKYAYFIAHIKRLLYHHCEIGPWHLQWTQPRLLSHKSEEKKKRRELANFDVTLLLTPLSDIFDEQNEES